MRGQNKVFIVEAILVILAVLGLIVLAFLSGQFFQIRFEAVLDYIT